MKYCLILAYCLISLPGCRISRAGGEHPYNEGVYPESATISPAPLPSNQKSPVQSLDLSVQLDETGRVVDRLVLHLDYFPPPRPDGVSIPSCQSSLSDQKIIGKLSCNSSLTLVVDIIAAQVTQRCVAASPAVNIDAKQPILLPGCKGIGTIKSVLDNSRFKLAVLK